MRRLALIAALALVASPAGAADTAKMKTAQTEITSYLKTILRAIEESAEKRDGGARLTAAKRELDKLEDSLEEYADAAKGDRTGEELAKDWTADHATLEKAIETLISMKALQYAQEGAAKRCTDAEAALIKKVDDAVKANKVTKDLITAWNAEADKLAPIVKRGIDDYEDKLGDLKSAHGRLRVRANDKLFEDTLEELPEAGEDIVEAFEKEHAAVKAACKGLLEGKDNDKLVKAIGSAKVSVNDGESAYDLLEELFATFNARVTEARKWHPDAEKKIFDALCDLEEDDDGQLVEDAVYRVADAQAKLLREHVHAIREQGERILSELEVKKKVLATLPTDKQDDLAELKKKVAAKLASVDGQLASGMGQGANHPVIRTRIEKGKARHLEMQRDCDASEVVLGSGKRIDCVDVLSGPMCIIKEFKPNNPAGKRAAPAQAVKYLKEVLADWNAKGKAAFDAGKMKVFERCIDPKGKLKVDSGEDYYDFCMGDDELGDVRAF